MVHIRMGSWVGLLFAIDLLEDLITVARHQNLVSMNDLSVCSVDVLLSFGRFTKRWPLPGGSFLGVLLRRRALQSIATWEAPLQCSVVWCLHWDPLGCHGLSIKQEKIIQAVVCWKGQVSKVMAFISGRVTWWTNSIRFLRTFSIEFLEHGRPRKMYLRKLPFSMIEK